MSCAGTWNGIVSQSYSLNDFTKCSIKGERAFDIVISLSTAIMLWNNNPFLQPITFSSSDVSYHAITRQ